MSTFVLVEGESDRIAVEALAVRQGFDLTAADVKVLAVGGAHALLRVLTTLDGARVAGLYDRAEERSVLQALERAGRAADGFFACSPDLEGELVRALGVDRMLRLVEERGHLTKFHTYQAQPGKRELELERQLHGWLHNWKVRYAAPLVEALELDRVPAPLHDVLAYAMREAR